MTFKIGDKILIQKNKKTYTISAVHDYGFEELGGVLSIWAFDELGNNITTNSNKARLKKSIMTHIKDFFVSILKKYVMKL